MTFTTKTNDWGEPFIDELHRNEFLQRPSAEHYQRYPVADFSQTDTLFVITGSDSGLLPKWIAGTELGKGSRVVIIEPDDIYEYIVQNKLAHEFVVGNVSRTSPALLTEEPSVTLHRQSEWQDQVFDTRDFRWFCAGRVLIDEAECSRRDYNHVYLPLFKTTQHLIEQRQFEHQVKVCRKDFIITQLINAADNIHSLKTSDTFGSGATAVVLGGGHSLDEHIDWIIDNRDKLFIIVVSRLCQRLQKLSLKPDLVVNIDPYTYSYDASKHGLLWDDVTLVHSYHAVPGLVQQWRGPVLYLGHRLPWARFDDVSYENAVSAAGPTVGHTAVRVASQLGFTQILMSGIDHCYSASLNSHSSESPESIIQKLPTMYNAQIETYAGRQAGTQHSFLLWINFLEQMGEQINAHAPVLFNLSENAAKANSIPHRSVKEIHLPGQKPDIATLVAENQCADPAEDLKQLRREINRASHGLKRIRTSCSKAQRLINRQFANGSDYDPAAFASLERLESTINRRYPQLMQLIKNFGLNEFTQVQRPSGFSDMTRGEEEQWIRSYYRIISDTAKELLAHLEALTRRITLREQELSASPDFKALVERWIEDDTPGRALLFSQPSRFNQQQRLPAVCDQLADHFLASVASEKTGLQRKLQSYVDSIDQNLRSLLFLYNAGNSKDLEFLIGRLDSETWPAKPLAAFSEGLVAELHQDRQSAVEHYQRVVDCCSERLDSGASTLSSMLRLLEESLVRMTSNFMSLKDYGSACATMGILCEMLPRYVVSYAKLINLTGSPDSAIDLLKCYIDNFSNEWRAATLLADLYESQGLSDKAIEANRLSKRMRANLGPVAAVSTGEAA